MRRRIVSCIKERSLSLPLAVAIALLLGRDATCVHAADFQIRPALNTAQPARFIRTGHDGMPVDSLPLQHITRVVKLPAHKHDTPLYSFFTAYTNFFPDQLRSWRLVVLNGKLAGHRYQIYSNGPDSITITDLYGSLDNLAIDDMVMVESVVERYIPER